MKGLALVPLTLSLAACQATLLAQPSIVYQSGPNIGVEYVNVGLQGPGNEKEAMSLISKHCNGRFEIKGRSERRETSYVDATCTQ